MKRTTKKPFTVSLDSTYCPAQQDERCEMCGALKTDDGVDHHHQDRTVEALRILAELWIEDARAVNIVLCKVLFPHWSYRDMECMVAVQGSGKRSTIHKMIKQICHKYPLMNGLLLGHSTKTSISQSRRRTREKEMLLFTPNKVGQK